MPREAARIFLRVTDVRVERLQEISQKDIYAEGMPQIAMCNEATAILWYKTVWDRQYAIRGYGWDTNPRVWVYGFERIIKEELEAL